MEIGDAVDLVDLVDVSVLYGSVNRFSGLLLTLMYVICY